MLEKSRDDALARAEDAEKSLVECRASRVKLLKLEDGWTTTEESEIGASTERPRPVSAPREGTLFCKLSGKIFQFKFISTYKTVVSERVFIFTNGAGKDASVSGKVGQYIVNDIPVDDLGVEYGAYSKPIIVIKGYLGDMLNPIQSSFQFHLTPARDITTFEKAQTVVGIAFKVSERTWRADVRLKKFSDDPKGGLRMDFGPIILEVRAFQSTLAPLSVILINAFTGERLRFVEGDKSLKDIKVFAIMANGVS